METNDILRRFTGNAPPEEIEKGGSGRKFFRVKDSRHGSAILCIHDKSRAENALAADIAAFLREKLLMPVPRILEADASAGLILFEDLGSRDLWSLRDAPAEERLRAWGDAMRSLAVLHSPESYETFLREGPKLMDGFGPELYRWERDYFRDQAVKRILGKAPEGARAEALESELQALAERLGSTPKALVHRDCQSQNLLLKDEKVWFIDFQGMRSGSAFYDLGSVLFDPYVKFTTGERARLLGDYAEAAGTSRGPSFVRSFLDASAQRLMQALGAYHFLGREKGRTEFLTHVRPALGNLVLVTRDNPGLPVLRELAEEMYVRHLVDEGFVSFEDPQPGEPKE